MLTAERRLVVAGVPHLAGHRGSPTDNTTLANGKARVCRRQRRQEQKHFMFQLPPTDRLLVPYRFTYTHTARQNQHPFTFISGSAFAAGLEVISAPQPAHLRHLGLLKSNVADVKEASFFPSCCPEAAAAGSTAQACKIVIVLISPHFYAYLFLCFFVSRLLTCTILP